MATKKPKTISYRRKRDKQTNYHKRLLLLLSREKRLVVRITNQKVLAQLAQFMPTGDKILLTVDSFALKKLGWTYSCKNLPAAYLTGLLFGKKAVEKGYTKAILDTGLRSPLHKGRVYAFLKGVLDAGVDMPHGSEEIFPEEGRMKGEHIKQYAAKIKNDTALYKQRFTQYLKNNAEPQRIEEVFETVRGKITR